MQVPIKVIQKHGILQHDSSDCGVACLATVIGCLGGDSSLENLRKLSGTDKNGTSLLGLYQASNQCGFDATGYEAGIEDIKKYNNILILHTTLENGIDHYIVCFSFVNKRFTIWDPGLGIRILVPDELDKIWVSRKCLGLIQNKNFVRKVSQQKHIISWLKEKILPDLNILIASLVIGIGISVLSMVMAVFTQKLIDKILPTRDFKSLLISMVLLFLILIAKAGLGYIRQTILIFQGKTFNIRIINDFFGLVINLPKTFYDSRKKGDFIGRLNDTMRIQKVITEFVSVYLIDLLVIIVSLIFLFLYSVSSALITLAFFPILFFSLYKWNKKIINSQREVMAMYAGTESNYIDSLGGITEIKSLSWQQHFIEKNNGIFSCFQERIFDLGKIKLNLGFIAGCIGVFYLIIILLITGLDVINNSMTSGELLAVLSISSGTLPSLINLSLIAIPLSEVKVALSRMFEFTQSTPEIDKNIPGTEVNQDINSLQLKDVCFRFPGRTLLLNQINIKVKKGEITALIGESGGGKSTIAGIFMRFYETESGDILVNHFIQAKSIPLDQWRSKIVIIPQEVHIFNGTILQNILPDPSENQLKDLGRIIEEFELAGFFDSFPAGMLSMVGEDGLSLSGGQKQIIAFVRAVLKRPDFLIIDEGTSNLDSQSENIIIRGIQKVKENSGILMISHKQELIRTISDVVYNLEGGRLSCSFIKKNENMVK